MYVLFVKHLVKCAVLSGDNICIEIEYIKGECIRFGTGICSFFKYPFISTVFLGIFIFHYCKNILINFVF